jgi:hypothetical protein
MVVFSRLAPSPRKADEHNHPERVKRRRRGKICVHMFTMIKISRVFNLKTNIRFLDFELCVQHSVALTHSNDHIQTIQNTIPLRIPHNVPRYYRIQTIQTHPHEHIQATHAHQHTIPLLLTTYPTQCSTSLPHSNQEGT